MRALTSDVFCAGYLILRGATLVDLIVDDDGHRQTGTFVLEGPDAVASQEEYSRGDAQARVKSLRDAVSSLRTDLARALRGQPFKVRHNLHVNR